MGEYLAGAGHAGSENTRRQGARIKQAMLVVTDRRKLAR